MVQSRVVGKTTGSCLEKIREGKYQVCHIWTINNKKDFECVMCRTPYPGTAAQIAKTRTNRQSPDNKNAFQIALPESSCSSGRGKRTRPVTLDGDIGSNPVLALVPIPPVPPLLLAKSNRSDNWQMKHICLSCGASFFRAAALSKHVCTNQQMEVAVKLECKFCNETFGCPEELTAHLPIHNGVRPYSCRECKKNFTSRSSLLYHMRTIHKTLSRLHRSYNYGSNNTGRHICTVCGKRWKSFYALKRHIAIHSKELFQLPTSTLPALKKSNPHLCVICGRIWQSKAHLKRHMETHNRSKPLENQEEPYLRERSPPSVTSTAMEKLHPHVCVICGRIWQSKAHLKRHMETHNRSKALENQLQPQLQLYLRERGPSATSTAIEKFRPHVCNICGKRWRSISHLKRHMESHNRLRKLGPNTNHQLQASSSFVSAPSIDLQMEHPIYSLCEKQRPSKADLKHRLETRNPSKQAVHSVPNAYLQSLTDLTQSALEKPLHICEVCGTTFRYPSKLREHIRVHKRKLESHLLHPAGQEDNDCAVCGQHFGCYPELREHLAMHEHQLQVYLQPTATRGSNYNVREHVRTQEYRLYTPAPAVEETKPAVAAKPSFVCNVCGTKLPTTVRLRHHLATHENRLQLYTPPPVVEETNLICNICGKWWQNKYKLNRHLETHNSARRYIRSSTETAETLPHVCTVCGKRWRFFSALTRHMTVHNQAEQPTCPICNKQFSKTSNLYRHIESIHIVL